MSALDSSTARSQRQVATSLRQTEANISRQLQAMKQDGLVSVTRNKKDGRQRDVKLTAKGAGKYQKAASLLKKLENSVNRQESRALTEALENSL